MTTESRYVEQSKAYLTQEYLPKIRACCARLSREQLWWRPNDKSNSVANLVLHLAGNVRQWIVAGVGDSPDERRREEEFDARGGLTAQELLTASDLDFYALEDGIPRPTWGREPALVRGDPASS